jgi:hypothetical protein
MKDRGALATQRGNHGPAVAGAVGAALMMVARRVFAVSRFGVAIATAKTEKTETRGGDHGQIGWRRVRSLRCLDDLSLARAASSRAVGGLWSADSHRPPLSPIQAKDRPSERHS